MSNLKVEALAREFHYNGIRIPDPGPDLTVEQVRDLLTPNYPEIATASNARIHGKERLQVSSRLPGREFQQSMLSEKVAIGRTWKAMPTYVRVTVGTADEMAKFQAAFVKCMEMPVTSPTVAYLQRSDLYIPSELDHNWNVT